jgi:hypothetical protein
MSITPSLRLSSLCSCGRTDVVAKGLCATCYTLMRRDEEYYGGLREEVLKRDGYACRVCSKRNVTVHHRVPGVSSLDLMITLCIGCHSRVHKLGILNDPEIPELLRFLWREQHPDGPEQYVLNFILASENSLYTVEIAAIEIPLCVQNPLPPPAILSAESESLTLKASRTFPSGG